MMCINRMMMLGRAGDAPIAKEVGASRVAEINVALSEKYRDAKKEVQEKTEWVRLIAWGKLAEIAEKYIRKGSCIYAEGKLQTAKWQAKDGTPRSRTEVYCTNLIVLDGQAPATGKADAAHADYAPIPPKLDAQFAHNPDDGDLPF